MSVDTHLGRTYGNVRLTARLGQGAMGAVYRGMHLHFAREVAVKVLLSPDGKGNSRERFLREGQAAARIKHENVVQILDAGEADGVVYLVMELVEGYSLGKIVDDTGPLPPEAVARLGAGISLGLAAIHAQGIIHRDIKPDNILLGRDRKPKITDLGLAKQTDDPDLQRLTATGMVVGTPLYVSPENIRDPKSAGSASDIYSLGATLYHLLTGRPPFKEHTPYEVMRAHLESRVQPIRELSPGVPIGLAQLVERCLSKSPDKRPSAAELADRFSQGAGLKASPVGGMALMVALTALVVAALAAGAWFALGAERRREAATSRLAQLVLRPDRADCRARIDGGPWSPYAGEALALTAGHHHLEVRSTGAGALWAYEGDIDLAERGRSELPLALAAASIPLQRIAVPGEGMLFSMGVAFGLEPSFPVTQAGSYALARWDGRVWQPLLAEVDQRGQCRTAPGASLERPDGDAYWRRADDSGAAIPRHHVVSWWEAEQARSLAKLPTPAGWLEQGQHREQAALALTPALIAAMRDLVGARLPDREQARSLAASYRNAPLWCEVAGRLDYLSGGPRNALLILLPSEPGTAH
jgi:hypothetical protein